MKSRSPRDVKHRPAVQPGGPPAPALFDRGREVGRMRRALERFESPRLQMMAIVALTGSAGFLASYLMRHLGLHAMWLRYPLATAVAYVVFLALVWAWLHLRDSHRENVEEVTSDAIDTGIDLTPSVDDASYGPDFDLDVGGADLDEGAVLVAALAAVVAIGAAVFAVFAIVGAAPVLLAELVVDVALAGGLYRRVRALDRGRHWLRTAVARTAWRFAAVAALFSAAGALVAWLVPGAESFGDAWR